MFTVSKQRKNGKVYYYWKGIKIFSRKSQSYPDMGICLEQIKRKLCMVDSVWRNDDTLFYVPNYPEDSIQTHIVDKQQYYEEEILIELKNYIPLNAIILDIGSNIGNHTVFWAKEHNAQKILAFEPIKSTYDILRKNIQLNQLEHIVETHNVGLSDITGHAKIKRFTMDNIGGTIIEQDENANIPITCLDNINLSSLERIDFMKIDVEGHEINMLKGAEKTLTRFKPVIFIETFENNKKQTFDILAQYGYSLHKEFEGYNFLFKPN